MKECVTYGELEPVYEMLVSLMGDCTDEEWLDCKQRLKVRKMSLDGKVELLDALTKAVGEGKIELSLEKTEKKKVKKKSAPQLTSATFTYRYLSECPNRLMLLYQGLVKGEFIEGGTKPDDFMMLFEGKPSDVKIKWQGNQASLWYLFKVMLEKGYVEKPEGVGQWVVVQSHFLGNKNTMFADFNKQKLPQKYKAVLDALAELLNPNSYEDRMV